MKTQPLRKAFRFVTTCFYFMKHSTFWTVVSD